MNRKTLVVLALAVAVGPAAAIHAATLDVFDAVDNDMIVGDGIPIDNFTQNNVLPIQSISLALKARDRDTGQANAVVGNRYFVDPGMSSTSPSSPNLSVDYQFDPGIDGLTNYQLLLAIDFDPAVGATDFATIQLPIFDGDADPTNSWDDGDGYFTTNTDGHGSNNAWNDPTVPYVISNSWNLGFAFWTQPPFNKSYDPSAAGEYELRLQVFDPTGTTSLGNVQAFAVVVPEPATIALLGIASAGLGLLAVRRRRRA